MEYKVNNLFYSVGPDFLNTLRSRLEMTEPVNEEALRKALDLAISRYPYFSVKLERKDENYVLAYNPEPIPIISGGRAVPLGGDESQGHLMVLSYIDNLIYVDTSHFLMDGNGQFPFIKTLLYCYLKELHPEEEFDTSGIALPGSEIPFAEADDDPFPENEIPLKPLGIELRPKEVLKLDDLPQGYEGRADWTSFRMKVKQKAMMRFASSIDGSPASFIASIMYRVISEMHPDSKLPVVCGMQHEYRKALGNPFSHLCLVNILPIVYADRLRDKSLETLNTIGRGVMILRGNVANDRVYVNNHVINEKKIRDLSLDDKRKYMRDYVIDNIGENTFEVSYAGRVPFSGLDKYVTGFTPILDMSLSGGISIEIFAINEFFCINIMQRNSDTKYVDRFIEILHENDIECEPESPEHFEINDFVMPR